MSTLQNAKNRRRFVGLLGTCCVGLLAITACTKQPDSASVATTEPTAKPSMTNGELDWAREALQRNPSIEVVATDTAAGVFTIRFKDSGEVRAVKLSELAATPISALTSPTRTAATTQESPAAPPTPTAGTQATQPANAPTPTSTATTADAASEGSSSAQGYTIQRDGGQLRVSGPGVSIVSTGEGSAANTGESNQRSADPIICEGRRMLHFDNRDIHVEGDAIIARGGCELYITNSRVTADGTGVVVDDAIVHIANSTIQGSAASFDASDAAKVYVRGSTFQGLPRRAERAVVQDQGGNVWR